MIMGRASQSDLHKEAPDLLKGAKKYILQSGAPKGSRLIAARKIVAMNVFLASAVFAAPLHPCRARELRALWRRKHYLQQK
jgi:hypothetical protein